MCVIVLKTILYTCPKLNILLMYIITFNNMEYTAMVHQWIRKHNCQSHNILLRVRRSTEGSAEASQMKNMPYRVLIGSLLWVANDTRPDVSFAVNRLAKFTSNPGLVIGRHYCEYLVICIQQRTTALIMSTIRR